MAREAKHMANILPNFQFRGVYGADNQRKLRDLERSWALEVGDLMLPTATQSIRQAPDGYIGQYLKAGLLGFRPPFHVFVRDVLRELGVSPMQLTPNSCFVIASFMVVCRACEVQPSVPLFFTLNSAAKSPHDWVRLGARDKQYVGYRPLPSKHPQWNQKFFFVRAAGDLEGIIPSYRPVNLRHGNWRDLHLWERELLALFKAPTSLPLPTWAEVEDPVFQATFNLIDQELQGMFCFFAGKSDRFICLCLTISVSCVEGQSMDPARFGDFLRLRDSREVQEMLNSKKAEEIARGIPGSPCPQDRRGAPGEGSGSGPAGLGDMLLREDGCPETPGRHLDLDSVGLWESATDAPELGGGADGGEEESSSGFTISASGNVSGMVALSVLVRCLERKGVPSGSPSWTRGRR